MYLQVCKAGFSATLDFYHFLVGSHIKQTVKHHLGGGTEEVIKKEEKKRKRRLSLQKEFIILMEAGKRHMFAIYLTQL